MNELVLTVGISRYDHIADLVDGRIACEGLRLRHLELPIEEIFHRFIKYREWDVSEISMAKYSALVANGDESLVGLPVFPSRMFRHSSMYVCSDSGIDSPTQLAGMRIGVPEWAQTASVYTRGLLAHHYGVPLTEVEWHQGGVNEPGRAEKVELNLPDGVQLIRHADVSLSEMLLKGELDAVFSAHPPDCFETGDGQIRRLIDDWAAEEAALWQESPVFPIMHTVVIRRDVVEAAPWVPTTLYKAFVSAKKSSMDRLRDMTASRYPVPMLQPYVEALSAGGDPWPYGLEENRPTLETFLQYGWEQGVLARKVDPVELFHTTLSDAFRI